jgi:hypothetical protein
MSNTGLAILVLVLSIAVALVWTNPSTTDYLQYLEVLVTETLNRMDPNTPAREREMIRRIFQTRGKRLLDTLVRPNTQRHNYGLYSLFETQVLDVRVRVLGVGGRFFPLDGVEEVGAKVGGLIPMLSP